jgi:hypothetical protein
MTLSLLITSVVVSALLAYIGLQVMYAVRKYKMHEKEEKLLRSAGGPIGSGLCHGMVLNPEKNGVIRDSKKSSSWFSRLV